MRTWLTGGMIGLAAALAIGTSAVAADDAQRTLTLDRVFGSPDLSGSQPRAMKLSPDGKLLTLLKPRADEKSRFDLWARDTATGEERMLVETRKLEQILRDRSIPAWVDYWGGDVSHDWPWWHKQLVYFFGRWLDEDLMHRLD